VVAFVEMRLAIHTSPGWSLLNGGELPHHRDVTLKLIWRRNLAMPRSEGPVILARQSGRNLRR